MPPVASGSGGHCPSPCDLLVVGDPSHLIYFAGYAPSPFVFRTVESGALLLLEPGRATLVADDMLGPFLEQAFVDERVAPVWYDGQHSAPHRRGQLVEIGARPPGEDAGAASRRRARGVPSGVVEGLRAARPGLEIVDIGPLIRPLRRAKDADEVAVLRRSMRAGEAGSAAALEKVRPGMTELDVYLIVQNAAMTELGEQAIVYGDFASGPAVRHAKRGARRPRGRSSRATCSCSTSRWSSRATAATSPTRSPSAAGRRRDQRDFSRRASAPCTRARPC